MKKENYEKVIDKSITEVKIYVLTLASGSLKQDIHDIVNTSIDNQTLKKKIAKRKDIALYLFIKIKHLLDGADTFNEVERHIIFMNILLDPYFKPVISYKYKLFHYIVKQQSFTIENYCILRHLLRFNYKQLPDFIAYMCERLDMDVYNYHYLASAIFCLERKYKQAYQHLGYIEFDNHLEVYKKALYTYSPRKYRKSIEPETKRILKLLVSK